MLNKRSYWDGVYSRSSGNTEPSPFILWILEAYPHLMRSGEVIDMCCGNGRDTDEISSCGIEVTGVDAFTARLSCPDQRKSFSRSSIVDYTANHRCPGVLYCRFGFHAITETEQSLLIDWCSDILIAEMRSDRGNFVPDSSHARRLINAEELFSQVSACGYRVLFFSESRGYAAKEGEDPYIIRIIAKREN